MLPTRSIYLDIFTQFPKAYKLVIRAREVVGAERQLLLPTDTFVFTFSSAGNIILPDGTDTEAKLIELPVKPSVVIDDEETFPTITYDWEIHSIPSKVPEENGIATGEFNLADGDEVDFADLVAAGTPASVSTIDYVNNLIASLPLLPSGGIASQYLRGDNTWQDFNAAAVGLGSVQNYAIASQVEAEAGSANDKYMTPLRTVQAIAGKADLSGDTFTGAVAFPNGSADAPVIKGAVNQTGFYFGASPNQATPFVGVAVNGSNFVKFFSTTRAYDYPDSDIDGTTFLRVKGQLFDELTTKAGAMFDIDSLAANQVNNGAQVAVIIQLNGVPAVGGNPVVGTASTYGLSVINNAKTNNMAIGIEAASGGGWTEEAGSGTTPGETIAVFARAKDSDKVATGVFATATGHSNPTPGCIGVIGYAKHATDYNVGGFFGLYPFVGSLIPIFPTITESCALIASNNDETADIFQAWDNETVVFRIADGGAVTFSGSSFSGLTKAMVGLPNVDDGSDTTKNAAVATLTNKTISGATNTFSNIPQGVITNLTSDLGLLAPKANPQFSGNVGIGIASTVALNVYGTNNPTTQIYFERQSSNAPGCVLGFRKNRNVGVTPNPVLANDFLGQISFFGSDGTATSSSSFPTAALIHAAVETTATAGVVQASLVFTTGGVALTLKNDKSAIFGGAIQLAEMTAPSAPPANGVTIYGVDNGAGKTQLMALFSSGAAQQMAIQP